MKKKITLALSVLCIFTVMLVLASCGHEHDFSKWGYDDTNHWNICAVEGEECAQTTEKVKHTLRIDSSSTATCEASGTVVEKCTLCGYTKETTSEALGHDLTETVIAPTCTKEGMTKITCNRTGCSYTEEKDKVPPQHDLTEEIIAPTCTEGGITKVTCKACDYSEEKDATEALGHDEIKNVIEPTCNEGGYTEVTCSRCDLNETVEQTEKLEHTYENKATAPTCTEGGYTADVCTLCGDEQNKVDTDGALGHDIIKGDVVEPDCRREGYTSATCSRCDYSGKEDIVPALGHVYYMEEDAALGTHYIINLQPTCDVEGTRVYKCTRCNNFPIDGTNNIVAIPALGHIEQYKTIAPTCTLEGATEVTCTRCSYIDRRDKVDPLGHTYYKEEDAVEGTHYEVTLYPTCTEKGERSYYCQVEECKALATDDTNGKVEIEALGHNWVETVQPWCGNDGVYEYVCDRVAREVLCGATTTEEAEGEYKHSYDESKVIIPATCVDFATYECPVCAKEFVAYEGDEQGQPTEAHVYDSLVVTYTSTCTAQGYTIYGCTAGECGLTQIRDYQEVTPHTLGQVSEFGTVTCGVCNKSYVDITSEKSNGSDTICICGQDPCICQGTSADWEGYAKPKEPMAVTANQTFTITQVEWADGTHALAIGNGLIVLNSEAGANFTVVIYTEDGTEALHTFEASGNSVMIDLYQYETVGKVEIFATADSTVSFYKTI